MRSEKRFRLSVLFTVQWVIFISFVNSFSVLLTSLWRHCDILRSSAIVLATQFHDQHNSLHRRIHL